MLRCEPYLTAAENVKEGSILVKKSAHFLSEYVLCNTLLWSYVSSLLKDRRMKNKIRKDKEYIIKQ